MLSSPDGPATGSSVGEESDRVSTGCPRSLLWSRLWRWYPSWHFLQMSPPIDTVSWLIAVIKLAISWSKTLYLYLSVSFFLTRLQDLRHTQQESILLSTWFERRLEEENNSPLLSMYGRTAWVSIQFNWFAVSSHARFLIEMKKQDRWESCW